MTNIDPLPDDNALIEHLPRGLNDKYKQKF